MDDRRYWLGFSAFPGVGPGKFAKLLTYFGSARVAWHAARIDLQESRIGDQLVDQFIAFRNKFIIEYYEKALQKKNIRYVTLLDKAYPQLLKKSKKPPFLLYVRGQIDFNAQENSQTIGIVGTRMITDYGQQVTELFTHQLVEAGCVIVSGLALGVDSVAHKTTLTAKGKTIAVLGCGIDCCNPRENESLYTNILEKNGVIVSEYALGMPPSKGSFPSRNRIIAGLSQGILVTEGAAQSGSLITANDAFTNKRRVFAIPGPINSRFSSGPYSLIQQGATLVTKPNNIITELGIKNYELERNKIAIKGDTEEEQKILNLLAVENVHIDDLVRKTGINSSQLGGMLSLLEMKGIIKSLDSGYFCLNE